jgi:hypothetical protein
MPPLTGDRHYGEKNNQRYGFPYHYSSALNECQLMKLECLGGGGGGGFGVGPPGGFNFGLFTPQIFKS